jgi:glycosyltransferase
MQRKKHLYLFNETSVAMNYGIGTYIDHLVDCLSNEDFDITLVFLDAQEKRVQIIENAGYKKLIIPLVNTNNEWELKRYYRSVIFILKWVISPDQKNIFHLNYMTNYYLAYWINEIMDFKPLLTVHYTDWSFSLLGDTIHLKSILRSSTSKQKTGKERSILDRIERDKHLFTYCEKVITIAQHSYEYLLQIAPQNRNKFLLIPNALKDCYLKFSSKKRESVRKKYFIDDETKIIVFAGRLDEVKGVCYIIQVLKKILKIYPNLHLFIAGNGNYQKNMLETKGIWTKVSFTGLITKQQLFELFNIADMGIISSIHEEFGLVALEMMMHALPIVATDTSGLSEIFEDNVTALKVPVIKKKGKREPNMTILAEKMTQIIDNSIFAKQIGDNARKVFLEKYESRLYKKRMLSFYNNF